MFKKFLFFILFTAIVTVGVWFYYEKYINEFSILQDDVIEIVFADNIYSYSPYTLVESNNQRLRLIYEPLVKMDDDLLITPALANSFGRVDELTWEFTINPNITFHDGTKLTTDILISNFQRFKNIPELRGLISSITDVIEVDTQTIHIKTEFPDPVLLNKIASLYITPTVPLDELFENPNGTGPYKVARIQANKLSLLRNDSYYGRKPLYPKLVLTTVNDQFERSRYAANTDRVVLVYPVASSFLNHQTSSKFELHPYPTTSVNFFKFNFNRSTFRGLDLRSFFTTIIDDEFIFEVTDNLGFPANQFVSRGVFGYNPLIDINKINKDNLRQVVQSRNLSGLQFNIALPTGLENFGTVLKNKLNSAGLLPSLNFVEASDLLTDYTLQNNDLIFMGWKSDYGDASSFFENLVVSDAGLNVVNYSNRQVDSLISKSRSTISADQRQSLLRQAMKIISVDDPIGVPLFESETIYAVDKRYEYTPRVDGFIEPNNLKIRLQ
jgi:peptide/nickel transport system substrate-binding protein